MISTLRKITLLLTLAALGYISQAQDMHYSQFMNSPGLISPGLTGVFSGDTRIYGQYRNQWNKADAYGGSFSLYLDSKIYPKKEESKWLPAWGVVLNYDQAGDSRLSIFNPALNLGVSRDVSEDWIMTLGANVGLVNRTFDASDLEVNNPLDPDAPTETLEDQSFSVFDLGAGINFLYQKPEKRTKINVGVGAFHLNQGFQKFDIGTTDVNQKYPIRFSPYFDSQFRLNDDFDLHASISTQFQQKYNENVFGLAAKYIGNAEAEKYWALRFGVIGRLFYDGYLSDAVIPYARLDYKLLSVGLSYDINVSPLSGLTNSQGGLELWAQYRFRNFKKSENFKACEIF